MELVCSYCTYAEESVSQKEGCCRSRNRGGQKGNFFLKMPLLMHGYFIIFVSSGSSGIINKLNFSKTYIDKIDLKTIDVSGT